MRSEADTAPLVEIQNAIADIETLAGALNEAAYLADRRTQLAVAMCLVIIGEAANRLSEAARLSAPEIDWAAVVALRNRVAHGYGSLDHRLIWSIVQQHLPALRAAIVRLLTAV